MAIAPLSEQFARRHMRHYRIDATLLDQLAHRSRVMSDAGDGIAQFCEQFRKQHADYPIILDDQDTERALRGGRHPSRPLVHIMHISFDRAL